MLAMKWNSGSAMCIARPPASGHQVGTEHAQSNATTDQAEPTAVLAGLMDWTESVERTTTVIFLLFVPVTEQP